MTDPRFYEEDNPAAYPPPPPGAAAGAAGANPGVSGLSATGPGVTSTSGAERETTGATGATTTRMPRAEEHDLRQDVTDRDREREWIERERRDRETRRMARDDEQPRVVERIAPAPAPAPISDRVRWGPIWAGVSVAVAVFLLLQLALFATRAVDLDINPGGGSSLPLWSAIAAIIAFFVGGLVAGATARWKRLDDGLLQGVVMWSLATIGLVLVSTFAVGNLTSSLGGSLGAIARLRDQLTAGSSVAGNDISAARETAARACLFLGVTLVAAALGAIIGAKLWPRRRHLQQRDELTRTDVARDDITRDDGGTRVVA